MLSFARTRCLRMIKDRIRPPMVIAANEPMTEPIITGPGTFGELLERLGLVLAAGEELYAEVVEELILDTGIELSDGLAKELAEAIDEGATLGLHNEQVVRPTLGQ